MRKHYRNFNNRLFKQTDTIYYMWDELGAETVTEIGDELIINSKDREFSGSENWVLSTVNGSDTNNDFDTAATTGTGATEGTYFTDNYLNIASTSDRTYKKYVYLGSNYINEDIMVVGNKYRLSYSIEITAYSSGVLSVGLFDNSMTPRDVNNYSATASAQTVNLDFIYDGNSSNQHKRIGIKASTDSVLTAYFDNFSLNEIESSTTSVKYVGIHPTPSTNSKTIRYHYVVEPAALSADINTLEIDEDYEKAVVYGASAELSKRLRGLDFAEYDPMSQRLLAEFAVEKDKALRHSIDRDSERFVKVDYRDF